MNEHFIRGFVKRAKESGFDEQEAQEYILEVLKEAMMPPPPSPMANMATMNTVPSMQPGTGMGMSAQSMNPKPSIAPVGNTSMSMSSGSTGGMKSMVAPSIK